MGAERQADGEGLYAFDQTWRHEHERLKGMEQLWDPGTTARMAALGVAPGWRCLEVGTGAGSIAAWLAERVGVDGEVLATDISLVHLEGLERPSLRFRRHDILTDPLPAEHFDFGHARLLVDGLRRARSTGSWPR